MKIIMKGIEIKKVGRDKKGEIQVLEDLYVKKGIEMKKNVKNEEVRLKVKVEGMS